MKVLHLNTYDNPSDGSGAERIMWSLAEALSDLGDENVIVGTKARGPAEKRAFGRIRVRQVALANVYWPRRDLRRSGAVRKLWHVFDVYNFFMRRRLSRILNEETPDVVIIHNMAGWSVASLDELPQRNICSIQVLHDLSYACPNTLMFKRERNCDTQCLSCHALRLPHRRISNKLSAVVGVSHYMLERHLQLGYFKSVAIKTVIYNARSLEGLGVLEAQKQPDQAAAPNAAGEFTFGFIGTISAHKGIELLLKSFMDLGETNAHLIVAGDGQADYLSLLRQKFSSGNIHFMGRCEPYKFFSQVQANVVPSLWKDNLPGVVFESFAFGVPVIGSNRGGIVEMISNGENGILFDPSATGDLTRAMREMMETWKLDEARRTIIRASGERFFDVSRMARDYQSLYRELILAPAN